MSENQGFEHVVVGGRAKLRCTVCGTEGEPWEWSLARRHQHALMHTGHPEATRAERAIEHAVEDRRRAEAESARARRRVMHPPRRCANPFCSVVFQPRRSTARYCSTKCRVAAHRSGIA